jgi:hypothetical protein
MLTIDLILLTVTLTNDRPVLSSERAPHMDRTVTLKQEELGLDQDRLNDRQLRCKFDFGAGARR